MIRIRLKGMVLFVTLLIAAIVALFLAGAVQLLPTLGYSAANLSHKEQAVLAAQSGLEYARSRLQSDPAWRGNGSGLVVDTPELKVIEDNGNIFGILAAPNGEKSLFRFRFNYQNGNASPDEVLDDPSRFVDSPYVSYNNLLSANQMQQYRAELSGGVYQVTNSSPVPEMVPKYTADLIVEGFAGPALRNISVASPNPDTTEGKYTRQVLEMYLTRPGFLSVDSAVMAASELNAEMLDGGTMRVDSDNAGEPAKVRTLTDMSVDSLSANPANYVTPASGQVVVGTGQDFDLNGSPSTSPTADTESSAQQSPRWLSLGFDQITRAQPTDARVRAGTYMWRAGAGGPRLEYFAEDYTGLPLVTAGTVVSNGNSMLSSGADAIDLTPSNFRLRIKEDVLVESQLGGSVTGFTVLSEPGLMSATGRRPETLLNHSAANDSVIFSNDDGPVFIEGKIDGSGSVTSGDDITFQGTSALEADPTMSVALYAKGDVNLKAIPDEVLPAITAQGPQNVSNGKGKGGKGKGKGHSEMGPGPGLADNSFNLAQDVAFGGIVYAQGNFNVDLKQQDQAGNLSGTNHGSFFIKGVLATFGGDPETDSSPGLEAGKGQVNLQVKDARFIYDPDYLDALQDLSAPVRLDKSFWTTL